MTANELLKEVLKEPIFREKYKISEEEIVNISFDTVSEYKIIETVKTIILQKSQNSLPDTNIYKNIKVTFDL